MLEIAKFMRQGAACISLSVARQLMKDLPMLKLEFAQINAKKFPHLVDQLEFLANFVEDFLDGADPEIPYSSAAQAMFALLYCHKKVQIIPHFVQDFGYADDSAVVRAVLIENEKVFQTYAFKNSYNWRDISTQP